jgi:plastocyanin
MLAAFVAACGGAASSAGSAGTVETSTVDLPKSYRFEPTAISVPLGSTVTWTNNDNFTHSVQFEDASLPTEPQVMEPGASTTVTFDSAGTFAYICHLHPQDMQGTVTVSL